MSESISLPETMFSTGERFDYLECKKCGCLQISALPENISAYYPKDYYSYSNYPSGRFNKIKARVRIYLSIFGPKVIFEGRDWFEKGDRKSVRNTKIARSESILDLGCGQGSLISDLADIGFKNVLGADPFIKEDFVHANGAKILKKTAAEIYSSFDLVMMHHSLEHIWDQRKEVKNIARLMNPGGKCIIRIPTIDCWAWKEYGESWVQLDPPRHFYLHSRQSISRLLEGAGLEVVSIVDDSIAFQILSSESIKFGKEITPRTKAALKAKALNAEGMGDSIAVYARKPLDGEICC